MPEHEVKVRYLCHRIPGLGKIEKQFDNKYICFDFGGSCIGTFRPATKLTKEDLAVFIASRSTQQIITMGKLRDPGEGVIFK